MNMKKLFLCLLSFAVITLALPVSAQQPVYAPQSLSVPNVAESGVSNALNQVMGPLRQNNVAIEWATGPLVTNVTARFSASVSGVNYATNYYVVNMTTFPAVTNLDVKGIGFLRLDSVTTTGRGTATNTVYYSIKTQSP